MPSALKIKKENEIIQRDCLVNNFVLKFVVGNIASVVLRTLYINYL